MNIISEDYRKNIIREIEDYIRCNNGKVYIYGCAKTAERITEFIKSNNLLEIEGYIVDDEYFKGGNFLNKKIFSFSKWQKVSNIYDVVIIGFTGQEAARKVISTLPKGVKGYYFIFPYSFNAYNTLLDFNFYKSNIDRFENVYDLLYDELSKNTLQAYINACICGNITELDKYQITGQYFNSITKGFEVKCFVDCGAYTGDTIEQAFDFYSDTLTDVIAFEPDKSNTALLIERIENNNIPSEKLSLVNKGAWKEKDVLYFSSSDSSSNISDDGDIKVEVDSIDNIVPLNKKVDYIKMDIEGSEKEALIGASRTISICEPIMAVCVYHRPEDIFELFETILNIIRDKNYRYYLRYHGPDLRELVLYAIPVY